MQLSTKRSHYNALPVPLLRQVYFWHFFGVFFASFSEVASGRLRLRLLLPFGGPGAPSGLSFGDFLVTFR